MSTNEPRPMITAKDIAIRLRVSPMTVYRMLETGEIPSMRFGRLYRVYRDQFEAWLEAKERGE